MKAIRFFLPQVLERHPIRVINLMKDIQKENPDIYLTLKAKLRGLGLYNEEFSIQTMIYREQQDQSDEAGTKYYKQLEKSDLIKVISASSHIVENWHKLYIDHEPLQVAQLTLECIQSFIRKDHKIEQQVYQSIRIPYLRQHSSTLLEQIKEFTQQFMSLKAFQQFNIPSLIYYRVDLARLWVNSLNHIYEHEVQKLHN
jgi:hypothetical protein